MRHCLVRRILMSTVLVSSLLMLSGCITLEREEKWHDFTPELVQPRPRTLGMSKALEKMYSEFSGFGQPALGCIIDTAVWDDEVDTVLGGFRVWDVYNAVHGGGLTWSMWDENIRKLLVRYGTVPGSVRIKMKNDGSDVFTNMTKLGSSADSPPSRNIPIFEGSSSKISKTGLGVSVALAILTPVPRNRFKDELEYLSHTNIAYRLSPQEEKEVEKMGLSEIKKASDLAALTDFYSEKIFEAMKEAVQDMGYTIVGELVKWNEKPARAKLYYAIEGDNCPKANTKEPWKGCYIGLGVGKTRKGAPCHLFFSETGAKTANTLFDPWWDYNIYGPDFTPETTKALYRKLMKNMLKRHSNITFYLPAEEINGKWIPQRVVDSTGTYYFTVPVKRAKVKL